MSLNVRVRDSALVVLIRVGSRRVASRGMRSFDQYYSSHGHLILADKRMHGTVITLHLAFNPFR